MLATNLLAGVLIIIASTDGTVVISDSAAQSLESKNSKPSSKTAAIVGDRVLVVGTGYTNFTAKSETGAVIADYSFDALAAQLSKIFPHRASPAAVAEAARAQLAAILGHVGANDTGHVLPRIVLVCVGPERKQIEVWTVTVMLDQPTRPPIVKAERSYPGALMPYFGAYGVKRTKERLEADWTGAAPPRLIRQSPPFSIDEWAEVAGLMASTENGAVAPIRQWILKPSSKIEVKTWTKPE